MELEHIRLVAAKAVLINDKNEVLILKQNDPTISGHDKYHPPGGIVEGDELLEEALLREIKEETGMDAEIVRLLDVGEWTAQRDNTVMHFVGVFYLCKVKGDHITLQEDEASKADWVTLKNVEGFEILEPSLSVIKNYLQNR